MPSLDDINALLEGQSPDADAIMATIKSDASKSGPTNTRPRIEIVGLGGPWQNAAMVYGLEATNGYNPLRIGPYDRLVSPGESTYTPLQRQFPASFPAYDCFLGRLLGLQYLVLGRPLESFPKLSKAVSVEPLMQGPKAWVYKLSDPLPRITLESQIEVAESDEYVVAGLFPNRLSPSEVLIDVEDDLEQKYPIAAGKGGSAKIMAWRADRVEIDVSTPGPTILSLHDPWYPGWEVRVDGELRPILRTNILFRGVEVPGGAHNVVFEYRPLSLANLWSIASGIMSADE